MLRQLAAILLDNVYSGSLHLGNVLIIAMFSCLCQIERILAEEEAAKCRKSCLVLLGKPGQQRLYLYDSLLFKLNKGESLLFHSKLPVIAFDDSGICISSN